ncbi:unnamed protein product [Oikopleura dioica]|uniref:Uncharacterized protein n=1 Tax=Oikopleura dioica TaxID=34765 RepID=E4WTX5_OIKDI|nr:unnamed protein product [Oikopleura dioica]
MRLSFFTFLFGFCTAQDILNEIGKLTNGVDLTNIGEICKTTPADDDFISFVNEIRDVIQRLDDPLTKLMNEPNFQAFTVVDSLKIFKALLEKFDKKWCNKFLSVINDAEQTTDVEIQMQGIEDVTGDFAGTIMNILRGLGVNSQIDRLVAMAELEKTFVLSQKELFGEEIWSTIQTIIGAIDFTNGDDYSSSPAIYDETCDSIMSEVLEWINIAKPLVFGLINDFIDAFRGKEGLLSIGKMVFFEYRLAKHLLLNQNACEKLMEGAAGIYEELDLETASESINEIVYSIFEMLPRAASENSIMTGVMKIAGDFAKTEISPAGAKPLIYDVYKMAQIGETAIQAAPKMIKRMKSEAGPILEKVGMSEIATMLDEIKEEDVRLFATEMTAELTKSSNEMVCDGKSACDELTNFKAQVKVENDEASVLPGNGGGKTVLSFGPFLMTIFSIILA